MPLFICQFKNGFAISISLLVKVSAGPLYLFSFKASLYPLYITLCILTLPFKFKYFNLSLDMLLSN